MSCPSASCISTSSSASAGDKTAISNDKSDKNVDAKKSDSKDDGEPSDSAPEKQKSEMSEKQRESEKLRVAKERLLNECKSNHSVLQAPKFGGSAGSSSIFAGLKLNVDSHHTSVAVTA